jgi:transposase InsO family protein
VGIWIWDCRDGAVRGADNLVPAALWLAAFGVAGGNFRGSELLHIQRPNGSPISSPGMRLGANPSLPNARSRRCIRRDIYPPRSIDRLRDRPTSPRTPRQNAYAERLIGSIRRERIDHIVVFGERHLRHVLPSYLDYYNDRRTHLSLNKDTPISRAAEAGATTARALSDG